MHQSAILRVVVGVGMVRSGKETTKAVVLGVGYHGVAKLSNQIEDHSTIIDGKCKPKTSFASTYGVLAAHVQASSCCIVAHKPCSWSR